MKKTFNELAHTAKVWVYQAKEPLTEQQKEAVLAIGEDFIYSWESHGNTIPASIDIFYNQFVLITADDCGESLCGRAKDAQVRLMRQIEIQLGITLTDRMVTAYKHDETVKSISFNAFKELAKNGTITAETIVFNNLIETKEDFITKWETPAKNSWHKQFLN
ncbi:MAG: hypothetical protein N4A35_02800 [Flavobacteriales bacterium]|jgi:hypothetical protein|nr:hypothetical protein [Flavobacteriales bacterium]